MARSTLAAAAATTLLLVALAGPAGAQSPAPVATPSATAAITITCDDLAATPAATVAIDVAVGSSALVTLCSNPTTGYRWSEPASSDPATVSVGGWSYQAPDEQQPGAAGSETLTLVANAAGTANVTASYDQPWDGGQKGAWTLDLTVVARPAVTVDVPCEAFDGGTAAKASVEAAAGDAIVLTVCSNPSTGFSWSTATTSDAAVAVPGSWVAVAPASTEQPMPGAPSAQALTIAADGAGSATISASYDQPWDGGEKGAWTLELAVTVK